MICEFPQQNDSVVGMEVKHSSLLFHEGDKMHINIGGAMETLLIKTYEIFQCKTRAYTT